MLKKNPTAQKKKIGQTYFYCLPEWSWISVNSEVG